MPGMKSIDLLEVLQILSEKLSTKYAALAAIGVTTGCRISEILSLKRADLVDRFGNIKEHVKFVKLKARNENASRTLLIPPDFQSFIIEHLHEEAQRGYELGGDLVFRGTNGRPLKRQAVYATFRRALGRGYGTHWMRKTFAQEIYKYFLNENPNDSLRALDLTREALGHKQIDTTIKYLGIKYERIDNAQKSIFNIRRICRDGKL
jgi:integrase